MIPWEKVHDWVRHHAPETEELDFKAAFWPEKAGRVRGEEIAKDVAALLNARGGAIVVGVSDRDDRASGFSSAAIPPDAEQITLQALERHLEPRSASAAVHRYAVRGLVDGAQREVFVLEVGAWPHGAVAVRQESGGYRVPLRRGTHTIEMPWEDVMRDLSASHRRNWLRFSDWKLLHPRLGVFIGTEIRAIRAEGAMVSIPSVFEEPFAELGRVDQDVVHLGVLRTNFIRWFTGQAPILAQVRREVGDELAVVLTGLQFAAAQEAWSKTRPVIDVPVPFEVIRAAWLEESGSEPRLHILLDADLVFGGSRWYIRPSVTLV